MPKFILTLLLIFTTSFSWSQDSQQEKLEKRKAEIQKEIREKEEMLKKVRKEEKTVSNQLAIQNEKITLKQKLINTTSHQTKLLGDDIYSNQLKINRLRKDLEILKQDYTQMVVKAYKSRSTQSRAMFLLSSENFQQAYKRFQYMKQYASYRKMQGDEIKYKTESLTGYTEKIVVQKIEKEKLLQANEAEKKILEKEKLVQQEIAKAIKKSKAQITAEIKKKQQESRRIDGQINKLIRDAIASANKKVAAANVKTNPKTTAATTKATETSTKIVLTPEAKLVADNFKSNKGRLPWPVEKGFVSLAYGDQPHPVHKNLTVHNSGIEITTEAGASARAVFAGEVLQVQVISANNKAVYIQHGDFITVYLNLSSVSVSKGQKVSIKQNIGRIHTDASGKAVIKFLVLQNTTTLNPTSWLNM
jgi:septal ring factor EnvC (AmiA/AmiB activator)